MGRMRLELQFLRAADGMLREGIDKHALKRDGLMLDSSLITSYKSKYNLTDLSDNFCDWARKGGRNIKYVKDITVEDWNAFLAEKGKTAGIATLKSYESRIKKWERIINNFYRAANVRWAGGIVLAEVKRLASFAKRYENEFAREVMQYAEKAERSELEKAKTKLAKMEKRMLEIDNIIQRLYEDNVSGKITDERFVKMSRSYEKEQDELREKSIILSERVERESNRRESADAFLKAVRKYTRIRKLTPELLNELIEHIVIYQEEKIDGKRVQKLDIVYRCIGTIEIPDLIPDVALEVNTRKGVYLTYNSKSSKKE
ncbi:MAG: DUF4368 domain-containing protein [Clostridia bacterium]|nr:DUF4368 domain-containing protein [Clostridia bacterium]